MKKPLITFEKLIEGKYLEQKRIISALFIKIFEC
jgi:hypothetical protein